jgi:C_GCAxxG_C_C family probable redox protein
MSKKSALAGERFTRFNCAQTVFSLFAKEVGIDETTALKISSTFGGGMACGATCGAVTGALMVIGMKHGHTVSDPAAKAKTKTLVRQFNEHFKEQHGALTCKELLGYDTSTPEEADAARAAGVFDTHCPKYIKTACDLLEEEFNL